MGLTLSESSERDRCITRLQKMIGEYMLIFTRIEYGRGEKDYAKIYIIRDEPDTGLPAILDITYFVARAKELKLNHGRIVIGGGQLNKGLEAYEYARKAAGLSANQDHWREIR